MKFYPSLIQPIANSLALAVLLVASVSSWAEEPILRLETGGHSSNCLWLGFTPDGRELVSLGSDKVIRVWNVTNPQSPTLARTLRVQIGTGPTGFLSEGAISPQGDLLAVAGAFENNAFLILDLKTGKVLSSVTGHSGQVYSVSFSSDGKYLLSSGVGDGMAVCDIEAWRESGMKEMPAAGVFGHEGSVIKSTMFGSGSSTQIISTGVDGTCRIWKFNGSTWVTDKTFTRENGLYFHSVPSPTGRQFAATVFNGPVRLFSNTGQLLKSFGTLSENSPLGVVPVVNFSPNGSTIFVGLAAEFGLGGCVAFDVNSGKELSRFKGHTNTVHTIVSHPKYDAGTPIVASAGGDANEIHLWNGKTGKLQGSIVGVGRSVFGIAIDSTGTKLAIGQKNGHDIEVNADHPLQRIFDLDGLYISGSYEDSWDDWSRRITRTDGWTAETPNELNGPLELYRNGQLISTIYNEDFGRVICYSFVPGGRSVIVGYDFGLVMYDSHTGRMIKQFVGHEAVVWSVAVSADGSMLYSGSGDQTFRAWDLKAAGNSRGTVESLLNFFVSADGDDFIVWTNEGYYTGSPGADDYVGWHVNRGIDSQAEFASAWQYAKVFRRPDIVSKILQTRSIKEAVRLAGAKSEYPAESKVIDVSQNQDELAVPVVTIQSPASGASVQTPTIRVKGIATPSGRLPISAIRVLVNGRPASDTRGFVVQEKQGGGDGQQRTTEPSVAPAKPFDFEVGLVDGENRIEVIASTEYSTSSPTEIVVKYVSSVVVRPTLYLLGIGVASYAQSDLALSFPDDDVMKLIEVFKSQKGGLYKDVVATTLVNEQVTDRNIRRALVELQRSVTQHDVAIVIISGHGDLADGSYYFCPYDHNPEETAVFGVRFSDITEPLTHLPCKVLLCLDTCHAAGVLGPVGQRAKATTSAVNRAVAEMTSVESGVVVMASSTGRQSSLEDDQWGHGAFALALIEALSGKRHLSVASQLKLPCDLNADGVLELTEIDAYVTARVKELTGGRQQPVTERGRIPSFPIAIVP